MSHRTFLLILASSLACYACYIRAEQNPYARYIEAGFSVIDRWALEDVPDQELFDHAMEAMVDVLHEHGDEHSLFVDSHDSDAFREEISQEFSGIGVRLQVLGDPPLPTVINLPQPGSPAAAADVRLGDRIAAVNGKPTAALNVEQVTSLVRGPVGESVKLTIVRSAGAPPRDVEVVRAIIIDESIVGDLRDRQGRWNYRLSEDPRIAYLRITRFGDKTAAEMQRILADLSADQLSAAILDVRGNGGGALDAAVDICDLFIRAGRPIVTTRQRDKKIRERYVSSGSGEYFDLPLAVIVDRNTASASEIVAACLQDYQRAAIVGERTFGKGTVQQLIRVESGRSLLKLTTATYWRPSGKNIHRMPGDDQSVDWGVKPDPELTVAMTDAEHQDWQRVRLLRDLVGDDVQSELARQVMKQSGGAPAKFHDKPLELAVLHLQQELDR